MFSVRSDKSDRPAASGMMRHSISLIDTFEEDQPKLFGLAYGMLGNAAEAEDIVQEVYLRVDRMATRAVEAPHAYLRAIVRRLCLDALTSSRAVREQPLESQLQAAVLIESGDPPLHAAIQREAISGALWTLLERLTPPERAVFILREVFLYPYEEIAVLFNLSVANCRQLFHRAQQHLAAGQERFIPALIEHERMVEQFLAASQRGNLSLLATQLVKDVDHWSGSWGDQRTAATKRTLTAAPADHGY
jgi:RNA polymerase sigma-70 factor, ECF subfamily